MLASRRGAVAVEYGLILALMVLVMLGGLKTFALSAVGLWEWVATSVVAAR